jgi:hypothetical protein
MASDFVTKAVGIVTSGKLKSESGKLVRAPFQILLLKDRCVPSRKQI